MSLRHTGEAAEPEWIMLDTTHLKVPRDRPARIADFPRHAGRTEKRPNPVRRTSTTQLAH